MTDANYQTHAEDTDELVTEYRQAMHVLSSRYSIPFDEVYEIFKPISKRAETLGQTAAQIWFENDGEFICGECATTCANPAEKNPDFTGPVLCQFCQDHINDDHAKTDRMNCEGTSYAY